MLDRTILIIIVMICHTFFFYLYCFQALHYSKKILKNFTRSNTSIIITAFLLNSLIIYLIYLQVPVLFLYLTAFVILCMDFKFFSQSPLSTALFGSIMFISHLSLIHLTVMGATGLILSITPIMMKADFLLYLLTYTIGWMIGCIFLSVFQRLIPVSDIIILTKRQYQIKVFLIIEFFILIYIFFDAYILFDRDLSVIINLYLVVSSISVGIFFYLFILHSLKIAKASTYKHNYVSLLFKIKEKETENEKLSQIAYSDAMTGVYSRVFINETIQNLIVDKQLFSIVYIDFDRLKFINDTLGHHLGDTYIQFIIQNIKDSIRSEDKIGRIGGDEFILVMPLCAEEETVSIIQCITEKLSVQKFHQIIPSFSYGVATYNPHHPVHFEKLVQIADEKMYIYKKEKRNK